MMAFCAKDHLHICAPMIPGLPSPNKAHAAQVGKVSTPATRHRLKRTAAAMDATPSGTRTNPDFLMSHKEEVFPAPPFWFTIATSGVVQLRGARYDGYVCKGPFAHLCTNGTRVAVAG